MILWISGGPLNTSPQPSVDPSHPQWLNWRWQLRNTLRGGTLARYYGLDEAAARWLDDDEEAAPSLGAQDESSAARAFAHGVTPYFASLSDRYDPDCPLRRQVLPDRAELEVAPFELSDPLGEDPHLVAPGLIHKYPDRVLLLVTDTCASYCRYCTRSRWVAGGTGPGREEDLNAAISWIEAHPEIADVLVSGGDPLLLSSAKLGVLLDRLCAIKHLRLVRVGSRVPIFLPMRIDAELAHALRPRRVPVWLNVHINHHRELSLLARERLGLLADAGIPLGAQTVLLRGVNDDLPTLRETFYAMLSTRVRPYYLFHCDPVPGSSHLRTSVSAGLELMRGLMAESTGMALPRYCVDLPDAGKIPLLPTEIESIDAESLRLRSWDGRLWSYPNR